MICEETRVRLDIRKLWLKGYPGLWMEGVLIPIVTTRYSYGGERRWFLCPKCDRRCAVLYEGFRCRLCIRGRYRIEGLSPLDRMVVKARKLRQRLGQDEPNPNGPPPEKPHRMRWHTYLRIRAEITRLELEVVLKLNERVVRREKLAG